MADQVYMIAFRDQNPGLFQEAKNILKSDKRFTHWWSHIPGLFLTTTTLDAERIATLLTAELRDVQFIVAAVDLARSEGLLPDRSWEWIRDREAELCGPIGPRETTPSPVA